MFDPRLSGGDWVIGQLPVVLIFLLIFTLRILTEKPVTAFALTRIHRALRRHRFRAAGAGKRIIHSFDGTKPRIGSRSRGGLTGLQAKHALLQLPNGALQIKNATRKLGVVLAVLLADFNAENIFRAGDRHAQTQNCNH